MKSGGFVAGQLGLRGTAEEKGPPVVYTRNVWNQRQTVYRYKGDFEVRSSGPKGTPYRRARYKEWLASFEQKQRHPRQAGLC